MDKAKEDDIQGLLKRAYRNLPETCYAMLHFSGSQETTKQWLTAIIDRITPASVKPGDYAIHVAFTYDGVKKFLPSDKFVKPFSREFTEGIKHAARSRVLGDVDENSPDKWYWNGTSHQPVDAILMIFAADRRLLELQYDALKLHWSGHGCKELIRLDTTTETGGKEHFGFEDGLAQPLINEFGGDGKMVKPGDPNAIAAGEFILGFKNEYGKKPFSPVVKISGEEIDLGENGSYMVFRQLEQDVKTFWGFMFETVKNDRDFEGKEAVYVASKMMGRWPNGNPLHLADGPEVPQLSKEKINNFLFKEKDPDGFGCPIGSHIRKSNPRDGIDSDPLTSIAVSKRHRLLRRGKAYGAPLAESMEPRDLRDSVKGGKRGLYFICFNTNISRQFEFIQHTWNNNPKFDGLYNDIDPISGFPFLRGEYGGGEFTIQHCPVRKKVHGIPQFVFVRGGAYFFMPGIRALRLMSQPDARA